MLSFLEKLNKYLCCCWHLLLPSSTFYSLAALLSFFSHFFLSPQCVTVIWLDLASSRRRASTFVRPTISACTVHAVTAVTASSQERWSLLWDARTTPSALSAVSAGTRVHKHTHNVHTVPYCIYKVTFIHMVRLKFEVMFLITKQK